MHFLQTFIVLLHKISVFLSVTLVDPRDGLEVAKGTVIVGREKVHGFPICEDEVGISIDNILGGFDKILHPQYQYEINAGGFAAWKTENCIRSL